MKIIGERRNGRGRERNQNIIKLILPSSVWPTVSKTLEIWSERRWNMENKIIRGRWINKKFMKTRSERRRRSVLPCNLCDSVVATSFVINKSQSRERRENLSSEFHELWKTGAFAFSARRFTQTNSPSIYPKLRNWKSSTSAEAKNKSFSSPSLIIPWVFASCSNFHVQDTNSSSFCSNLLKNN